MYHPNRDDKTNAIRLSNYIERDGNSIQSRYKNCLRTLDKLSLELIMNYSLMIPEHYIKMKKHGNFNKTIQYIFTIDFKKNKMVSEISKINAVTLCKSKGFWKDFDDILTDELTSVERNEEVENEVKEKVVIEENESEEEEEGAGRYNLLGRKRKKITIDEEEEDKTVKKLKVKESWRENSTIGISDLVNVNKKENSQKTSKLPSIENISLKDNKNKLKRADVKEEEPGNNFLDFNEIVEKIKIHVENSEKSSDKEPQEKPNVIVIKKEAKTPEKENMENGIEASEKRNLNRNFDKETFDILSSKLKSWTKTTSKDIKEDTSIEFDGVSQDGVKE